uniref:Uncharacterized protein n=1 Tax=Plectus sambesii TaxID=2011161 RepID=A0A914VLA8_9BILA
MRTTTVLILLFSISTIGLGKHSNGGGNSNSNHGSNHNNNNNNNHNHHQQNGNGFNWPSQNDHHGFDIDENLWTGVGRTQYQSIINIARMIGNQCANTVTAPSVSSNNQGNGNNGNHNQIGSIGSQLLAQVCPRWTRFVEQLKALLKEMFAKHSCALPTFFDQILTCS